MRRPTPPASSRATSRGLRSISSREKVGVSFSPLDSESRRGRSRTERLPSPGVTDMAGPPNCGADPRLPRRPPERRMRISGPGRRGNRISTIPVILPCRRAPVTRLRPLPRLSSPLHDHGALTGGPRSIPFDRLAPRDRGDDRVGGHVLRLPRPCSRNGSGTSAGRRPSSRLPSPSRSWCRRRSFRWPDA